MSVQFSLIDPTRTEDPTQEVDQLASLRSVIEGEISQKKSMLDKLQNIGLEFSGIVGLIQSIQDSGFLPESVASALSEEVRRVGKAADRVGALSLILDLLKNADDAFWLALVTLLTEEATASLGRQIDLVEGMQSRVLRSRNQLRMLVSGGDVKGRQVLTRVLSYAQSANKSIETALQYVNSGRFGIYRFTDNAIDSLQRAEDDLRRDLRRFRNMYNLQQFESALDAVGQMIIEMYAQLLQYKAEYKFFRGVIEAIYYVRDNILSTKEALNRRVLADRLESESTRLEDLIIRPLSALLQRDQLRLTRVGVAEARYYGKIRIQRQRLESEFGGFFRALDQMSRGNPEYTQLTDRLREAPYANKTPDKGESDLRGVITRATIPLQLGGNTDFTAIDVAVKAADRRFDSLVDEMMDVRRVLTQFTRHTSPLLPQVDAVLQTLGLTENPLLQLASGDLVDSFGINAQILTEPLSKTAVRRGGATLALFSQSYNQIIHELFSRNATQNQRAAALSEQSHISEVIEASQAETEQRLAEQEELLAVVDGVEEGKELWTINNPLVFSEG